MLTLGTRSTVTETSFSREGQKVSDPGLGKVAVSKDLVPTVHEMETYTSFNTFATSS